MPLNSSDQPLSNGDTSYAIPLASSEQSTGTSRKLTVEAVNLAFTPCSTSKPPVTQTARLGYLGSYTKVDVNGPPRTCYKVTVNEINYVAQYGLGPANQKSEQSESGGGETGLGKNKNRLRLWQVFFANPYEWWDYRKSKVTPNHPDFKHKDTGEALWLNSYDPPWIKRQLQRYDSRLAEQGQGEHISSYSRVPSLVYDE